MFRLDDCVYYSDSVGVSENNKNKSYQRIPKDSKVKNELNKKKAMLDFLNRRIKTHEEEGNMDTVQLLNKRVDILKNEILGLRKELEKENIPSHKPMKRKIKKRSESQIKEMVMSAISIEKEKGLRFVRKEDLAITLQVKESQVEKVLMVLNREGVVSQPEHHTPHDCRRGTNMDAGWDNSWCGDLYYIL